MNDQVENSEMTFSRLNPPRSYVGSMYLEEVGFLGFTSSPHAINASTLSNNHLLFVHHILPSIIERNCYKSANGDIQTTIASHLRIRQ